MAGIAQPYTYTATGFLGDKRETMLENQLLLRSELGRPMKRGYSMYPGEVFTYGRPNEAKDGGASEALSGWPGSGLYFHRKKDSGKDSMPDRDFMALNKASVNQGLTTAPEYYQYRATHDIRRKVQTDEGKKKTTKRIPPTRVFGISTRPSTPIHDLLEHKYQDLWLTDRRSTELAKMQKDETMKAKPGKVYQTRASQLRIHQVPVEQSPLWKLPRFSRTALPHLETFRGDSAVKDKAFKHHKSDCISRKGFFGHGVYEQAKN